MFYFISIFTTFHSNDIISLLTLWGSLQVQSNLGDTIGLGPERSFRFLTAKVFYRSLHWESYTFYFPGFSALFDGRIGIRGYIRVAALRYYTICPTGHEGKLARKIRSLQWYRTYLRHSLLVDPLRLGRPHLQWYNFSYNILSVDQQTQWCLLCFYIHVPG